MNRTKYTCTNCGKDNPCYLSISEDMTEEAVNKTLTCMLKAKFRRDE